mmetsp:Transcript_128916/g.251053  ORF Transcript_128916/g.251053 Transcript_128916/m.251053 type:complete len:158 (+) Transcript_128916:2-475(+)
MDLLRDRFDHCVNLHSDDPALLSYTDDATPVKTREDFIVSIWDVRVVRRGRQAGSYNIQRQWYRSKGDTAVLFHEPQTLLNGTAWTHYSCFKSLFGCLREHGHRGIAINHDATDRMLHGPLHNLLSTHYALSEERALLGLPTCSTTARIARGGFGFQ